MELWCLRAEQYGTVPALPSGFGVESLIIGGSDLMEDVPAVYDLCRAICATRTAQSLRCLRVGVRNDMYCGLIHEVFVANCTSLKEIALDLTRNANTMCELLFCLESRVSWPPGIELMSYSWQQAHWSLSAPFGPPSHFGAARGQATVGDGIRMEPRPGIGLPPGVAADPISSPHPDTLP